MSQPKDLNKELADLKFKKANEEIGQILDKYELSLTVQLRYLEGGILPVAKLVERTQMSEENQPADQTSQEPQAPQSPAEAQPASEPVAE